jgi:hypothetical protein
MRRVSSRYAVVVATLLVPPCPASSAQTSPPALVAAPSAPDAVIFDVEQVPTEATGVPAQVMLWDVTVEEVTATGFWVSSRSPGAQVFVRPAEGRLITTRRGESISIRGEVRSSAAASDDGMGRRGRRDRVYVYAYTVRPAWFSR